MIDRHYYKLDGHDVVSGEDSLEWGRWMQTSNRQVAHTRISDTVRVSTVFLGRDYSFDGGRPLFFETATFKGGRVKEIIRSSTWDEAEAEHRDAVKSEGGQS